MAKITMFMPTMGESVIEATVLKWLKKAGEVVTEEESIVEIATDKVDSEVPAPYTGKLHQILVQAGEVVKIGAPMAIILTKAEVPAQSFVTPTKVNIASTAVNEVSPVPTSLPNDGRFYSPLVRTMARQANITPEMLSQIPGTGQNNRVTKRDMQAYLQHCPQASKHPQATQLASHIAIAPDDELMQLTRQRQLIAERMVASKHIAPHVTSFIEADVTDLVAWRAQHKAVFEQQTGVKLTYTPLLLQAIVRTLQDFSLVNAWWVENQIVKKKAINIGLAVALPSNDLIVPVIKNAHQLSLVALAKEVQTLSHKARQNQLVPDELAEATYTVSNLGTFQNLMGTPIIMQPQVAILALGTIVKKPAVVAGPQGDIIAIRHKLYLSHSYDHRVIDGALGGGFLKQLADYLAKFTTWIRW